MQPSAFLLRSIGLTLLAILTAGQPLLAQTPEDGGSSLTDGGGQEVLESIYIPSLPNAPFSLTLAAEWTRPMANGGTFTVTNSRPIKRDSAGRIYQERWLLAPKGSNIQSRVSWIQIEDPVAHTYYQCSARRKVCELGTLPAIPAAVYDPTQVKSGPLKSGRGTRTHEDLGSGSFSGVAIHAYRDTTTLNAGELGNDLPMSSVREFRYAPALGINLLSILEAPQIGRQTFTVTELTTTDPDPSFFQPPAGYTVLDKRKTSAPTQ